MKYLIALGTVFLLATLGVSAMPYVKVLGVTPDLLLIFAVCWSTVRRQDEALLIVPAAGFIKDLTTSDPLGMSALGLAPVVLLAAVVQIRAVDSEFVPTVAVVAIGSCLYGLVSMAVLSATGQAVPVGDALLRVVVPAAIVNALFTAVVYPPVAWFSARPRTGQFGSSRPFASQQGWR